MLPNVAWLLQAHGPLQLIDAFVVPIVLIATLCAVLGKRLWLACLLLLPFVILVPIEALYVQTYGRPTTAEIIATVFASNLNETTEYLGSALPYLLISIAGAATLGCLAVRWCKKAKLQWTHGSRIWIFAICVGTPIFAMITSFATAQGGLSDRRTAALSIISPFTTSIELGYPFGLLKRFAQYRWQWISLLDKRAAFDNFRFGAQRTSSASGRQVYVLVIGESSRRDHWQLFGYPRTTNPGLAQRSGNTVLMPDMVSPWPTSMMAVPMVVSRKPATEKRIAWIEPSIIQAMKEAGFETYWISNQVFLGESDASVSLFALQADHALFLNHSSWSRAGSYDENLLHPFKEALAGSKRDLFIVLHMMGSHEGYDLRYPPSFASFRPTLSDDTSSVSSDEREINSYDNTILYTDKILDSLIRTLEEHAEISALWYQSDHGETLHTSACDMHGHGHGTIYEFQIPAFVWYSDGYGKAFADRVETLRSNATKPITSAVTFESLIDLAGLDFPGHDETMSLLSPSWHPRRRTVHGFWEVDIDSALISNNCRLPMAP